MGHPCNIAATIRTENTNREVHRMDSFSKQYNIIIYALAICLIVLIISGGIGGCGWSKLWYECTPERIRYEGGIMGIYINWTASDNYSGMCEQKTNYLARKNPLYPHIVFSIGFVPEDTLQTLQQLQTSIEIEYIWVTIDNSKPMKVQKCRDTCFMVDEPYHRYPVRDYLFGPLLQTMPLPERFVGSFDFIFRDPITGDEIKLERVQFVAKKKTKSFLRDFLDGR